MRELTPRHSLTVRVIGNRDGSGSVIFMNGDSGSALRYVVLTELGALYSSERCH